MLPLGVFFNYAFLFSKILYLDTEYSSFLPEDSGSELEFSAFTTETSYSEPEILYLDTECSTFLPEGSGSELESSLCPQNHQA